MNSGLSECAGDGSFPSTLGTLGFTVLLSSWVLWGNLWLLCCQSLPEPSCLPSCSEWFSCFSPGQNVPLPYPTRDTPGLVCVFRCFPQVRKTRSSFKGHLLQSILSLYKTLTKCILGDFSSCFPHLWPVFHSFFCLYILHFPFLLSNSGYFLQVVLQLINYLLGHLPFINFTFQP